MPWSIEKGHGCPVGKPWAVVRETDGHVEGCHPTTDAAKKQQAALYANEPTAGKDKTMDHLLFGVEWKAAGDTGELEGYMSVFNNVDQEGDVVLPGAFKKTFADWNRAKAPMPLIDQHQLSSDGVIGSVTHMAEDQYGAKVRAKFASTQKAQDIRLKMIEGHIRGMSFTYEALKSHRGTFSGKSVRFLDELRVYEATVSPFPVNQLAVASAKAKDPKKPYGDVAYADPGYQSDGVHRYPLDSETHCRAAWSYIHQADNRKLYTSEQLSLIEGRIRAALKKYGVTASESASLDFDAFATAAKSVLEIPVLSVQKAAMDLLLPMYHPVSEDDAAELTDGQPTADAAADTGEPADGTANLTAAAYAVSIIAPFGPRDDAPASEPHDALAYPAQVLESMATQADLDALEAQINQALGKEADR
jgi:HK97 family phage prohead protease